MANNVLVGRQPAERRENMTSPLNWQFDETKPQDRRDILLHGVQIAFGRIYATTAFGKYPNQQLEVARQAAFHLIDMATEDDN